LSRTPELPLWSQRTPETNLSNLPRATAFCQCGYCGYPGRICFINSNQHLAVAISPCLFRRHSSARHSRGKHTRKRGPLFNSLKIVFEVFLEPFRNLKSLNRASQVLPWRRLSRLKLRWPRIPVDSTSFRPTVPAPRCTTQRLPHLLRLLLMYQDNPNCASALKGNFWTKRFMSCRHCIFG
jgi:hypothetical protein